MRFYLITYDIVENLLEEDPIRLSRSEREERLVRKLQELGPTRQLLNNQWALRCSLQLVDIRDYLKEDFGLSDRMVVAETFENLISHWWTLESLNGF